MQTYIVNSPDFSAILVREADTVVQTGPLLAWACGRDFSWVRTYIESRGWTIQPLQEDEDHPHWLEIDGYAYELHWRKNTITRITLHKEGNQTDLCFDQLPEQLQKIL